MTAEIRVWWCEKHKVAEQDGSSERCCVAIWHGVAASCQMVEVRVTKLRGGDSPVTTGKEPE